ncbi:MAG: LacI family DNA-binding transcriptional regulator [Opitutaceae bacterium]|nr:LacI family DNA-binding transcriptional regulator [Opitutaceae bacterium]
MNRRITMADIARKAGVHVTTVSLALRNNPRLPQATRERIQALAVEMDYRPDPAIASLVAYRHAISRPSAPQPLAYVTGWHSQWGWKERPAHLEFFEGASARARQLGFDLQHFWLRAPEMTDKRMCQILHTRGITGLIIASYTGASGHTLDFEWAHFSAVQIDYLPSQPELHRVSNDQRGIMQLAMRRVAARGYRRIGLVLPQWWDDGVQYAWSAGYLAEQQALAGQQPIPMLRYPWPGSETGRPIPVDQVPLVPVEPLKRWLREHRPEVVFGHAPYVLPQLEQLGIAVPRDLAFVDPSLIQADGTVAGVMHNSRRVGELAVEILSGQLQHNVYGLPAYPTVTLVEGTWHEGASLPVAGPPRPTAVRR